VSTYLTQKFITKTSEDKVTKSRSDKIIDGEKVIADLAGVALYTHHCLQAVKHCAYVLAPPGI